MDKIWAMLILSAIVKLLTALAPFAWPTLLATIFVVFRRQFSDLLEELKGVLGRLVQAEVGGVKLMLAKADVAIEAFQSSMDSPNVVELSGAVKGTATVTGNLTVTAPSEDLTQANDYAEADILELAAENDTLAFIRLSTAVEQAARRALTLSAPAPGKPFAGPRQLARRLGEAGYPNLAFAYSTFIDVRNQLVHSGTSLSKYPEAMGVGLRLLEALNELAAKAGALQPDQPSDQGKA